MSQHPCVLPKQVPTAVGKLLQGVLELFGEEDKNTNDYNHYFITWHHAEHAGTIQGYTRRAHRNCTPGRSVCVPYAQPHRMNKMLVALLIQAE